MASKREITELIDEADAGNTLAAEQLFGTLYSELHALAEHNLRRAGNVHSLGATTLLHEAYLNIAGRADVRFPDRARFLAYASRAMRGLIIDYARRSRAQKRGYQFEITLAGDEHVSAELLPDATELERLGTALDELQRVDTRLAELVDLHFFCGYTFSEIAAFRGVSERTVQRDWRKARLLLHHALQPDTSGRSTSATS